MDVLICGDIGGTHTRLALFAPGRPHDLLASETFASRDFPGLVPLLTRFLGAHPGHRLRGAAFGVPGPASEASEELWMVNLPWRILASEVARTLGLPRVRFVNDFSAVALAIPHLGPGHLHALGAGTPVPHGPIAVLGAGTGLGESFLVWTGTRYQAVATECGHTDFAPRTAVEIRLLEYLHGRFGPVTWERVLSGPGLANLAEFLRDREGFAASPALSAALADGPARAEAPAEITRLALNAPPDPLCARAVELFCILYGAEAGNAALRVMATGGVYLAGGIAPRLLAPLSGRAFREAFEAKQGFAELLRSIPAWIVTHPNPGLLGAAIVAQEEFAGSRSRRGARAKAVPRPRGFARNGAARRSGSVATGRRHGSPAGSAQSKRKKPARP